MYQVYKNNALMGTHPTLDDATIKAMQAGGYTVKKDGKTLRKGG